MGIVDLQLEAHVERPRRGTTFSTYMHNMCMYMYAGGQEGMM